MKKLILLLTLALIVSSVNASQLLLSDNFNVNQIATGSDGGTPNWRLDAAGQPAYIPGQPATRQDGLYAITDYTEVGGPWYLIQVGSSEGDLPPELEPPNGSGRYPGVPGYGVENALQMYCLGTSSISPNQDFGTQELSVSVDVHVPYDTATGTAANAWVGIGNQNTHNTTGWGTGVALYHDNTWEIHTLGGTVASGVGTFGFAAKGMDAVSLVLDYIETAPGEGLLTVSIDGSPIATDLAVNPLGGYVTLAMVGSAPGEKTMHMDNLEVYGIPEPATMALLGLGGLALLRRKRS